MRTDINIGFFDLFIFLGVFQGLLLSWFFIKNGCNDKKANLYQGILILFLSLGIFEELLNNTGYIVKVLGLTNFSEPLSFAYGPLYYLYLRTSLAPSEKRKTWGHFVFAIFWGFLMIFQFIQPDELKYNSYVGTKHPDWGYLNVPFPISDDPFGIRHYCNELLAIQFIAYMGASVILLLKKFRAMNQKVFKTEDQMLIVLRNSTLHFLGILSIFLATKAYFGMGSDIGGYLIASYISFMIYATTYQVLNKSEFFNQPHSFLDFQISKYQKSSLSEEAKRLIHDKILAEMIENQYFTNNLASLSGLAKQINESSHHVSQVINETMDKNFFELLAIHRVEHAKKLIKDDPDNKLTVEELAELVGYNSKSSFNIAFKKLSSQTPSEFRKSLGKR